MQQKKMRGWCSHAAVWKIFALLSCCNLFYHINVPNILPPGICRKSGWTRQFSWHKPHRTHGEQSPECLHLYFSIILLASSKLSSSEVPVPPPPPFGPSSLFKAMNTKYMNPIMACYQTWCSEYIIKPSQGILKPIPDGQWWWLLKGHQSLISSTTSPYLLKKVEKTYFICSK